MACWYSLEVDAAEARLLYARGKFSRIWMAMAVVIHRFFVLSLLGVPETAIIVGLGEIRLQPDRLVAAAGAPRS